MNPQFDPKVIETLKAARSQVVQAGKSGNKDDKNTARGQSLNPTPTPHHPAKAGGTGQVQFTAHDKFAEEFVQRLAAIEQETAGIDEEIAKLEKIWLSLAEKKKQLETRRNELIKVKDKLKELDKEMSAVLKPH